MNSKKSNKEMFYDLYSFLLKYDHNINKLCNTKFLKYHSIDEYRDDLGEILDSNINDIKLMFNSIYSEWILNIKEFCIWWMEWIFEYEKLNLSVSEKNCYYELIESIVKVHNPISSMSKLSEIVKLIFRITSINKNIENFKSYIVSQKELRTKVVEDIDILFTAADWLFLSDYWYSDDGIYQESIIMIYENLLECIKYKEKLVSDGIKYESVHLIDDLQEIIKNSFLHYQMKLTAYDRIFPNSRFLELPNMFRKMNSILQNIKDSPSKNKSNLIKFS